MIDNSSSAESFFLRGLTDYDLEFLDYIKTKAKRRKHWIQKELADY